MKKAKTIITVIILLSIIIILILFSFLSSHIRYNDDSVIGNTAGNLNNQGLFCEQNGIVYFSNAYDSNVLYSMNADETNLKRLNNVSVKSINTDGSRLFYYQDGTGDGSGLGYVRKATGLYRCNLKGQNALCLKRDPAGIVSLAGNYLYYQHYTVDTGTYLDKIKIDKKEEKTILEQMVSPAGIANGLLYFSGNGEDHFLYAVDLSSDQINPVWEHNMYNPVFQNEYIYFMDLETDYELHRYNLSDGSEETIVAQRLDYFNIYDNVIFYQTSGSSPALRRVLSDGSNDELIREGSYENVNITSQYAYFHAFDNKTPVYHQSTFGSVNVTTFDAAANAAMTQ